MCTNAKFVQILHIDKAAHTSSAAAYGNKRGQYLKIYLCDTSDEGNGAILTLYDHQISLSSMLKKVYQYFACGFFNIVCLLTASL